MFWPTIQQLQARLVRWLGASEANLGLDNRTANFRVICGFRREPYSPRTRCPSADVNLMPRCRRTDCPFGLHGVEGSNSPHRPITGTNQGRGKMPQRRTLIGPRASSAIQPSRATGWSDSFDRSLAATAREWEWRQWRDTGHRLGTQALL